MIYKGIIPLNYYSTLAGHSSTVSNSSLPATGKNQLVYNNQVIPHASYSINNYIYHTLHAPLEIRIRNWPAIN